MIIILAKHTAWGAADNLYRAFVSKGYKSALLCLKDNKYNRTKKEKIVTILNKANIDYWMNKAKENGNILIICSPTTIKSLSNRFGKQIYNNFLEIKKKIIFITGTEYLKNYETWNNFLDYYKFNIRYSEAEMITLSKKNMFLPHPMEYEIPIKNDIITISHSPGLVERPDKKGTYVILKAIDKLKIEFDFLYDHIVGVEFSECIRRKGQSHIFIDQINPKIGGIGKNGYEGIALGCATFASVNSFKNIKDLKMIPPVININNENDLYYEVKKYLIDFNLLKNKMCETKKWKQNNYENTVNRILGNF